MITTSLTQKLLADATFDIEFNGYLSNHAKHAIVALDKLKAPDSRIQEYWDEYTTLTPYTLPLHKVDSPWPSLEPLTHQEWEKFRGQKILWQRMVTFLDRQDKSSDELVQEFAPALLDGIAGALTHGIIHLGWGVHAKSPWMVKEGLAYLNFCHVPMAPSQPRGTVEPNAKTSLLRVAQEWEQNDLGKVWIEATKKKYDESFHPELVVTGFQWQLAKVLKDAHPIATNAPSWIRDQPLDEVYKELYRMVALVYLATRSPEKNGNFVVLHLFTSLWGLQNVLDVIGDEATARTALEGFWTAAICTLSTASSGFPSKKILEAAIHEYPFEASDDANFDWTDIVKRGCAEEEEHNIKLVYVAKELWNRYGRWTGFSESSKTFTLTPNISPSQTTFSS